MATIWVDVTDFKNWRGHLTGIQRVAVNVGLSLKESKDNVKYIYYDDYLNKFLEAEIELGSEGIKSGRLANYLPLTYRNDIVSRVFRKLKILLIDRPSPAPVQKGDVFFVPGSNVPYKRYAGLLKQLVEDKELQLVHVVHDVLPLTTPHYFDDDLKQQFSTYFRTLVPVMSALVSVSQTTNDEVASVFAKEIKQHNVATSVIPSGSDFGGGSGTKPAKFPYKSGEFVISVGTIEPRKNRELLYAAYRLAANEGVALPPLIVSGKKGWRSSDFLSVASQDPAVKDSMIIRTDINDEELLWLYQNCKFSVYPSHAEGWGLPIAESLYYGKPCIAVEQSSMPEAAQGIIVPIDAYDSRRCMQAIVDLNKTANYKKEVARTKKFSPIKWSDSSKQYADLLDALVENGAAQ